MTVAASDGHGFALPCGIVRTGTTGAGEGQVFYTLK